MQQTHPFSPRSLNLFQIILNLLIILELPRWRFDNATWIYFHFWVYFDILLLSEVDENLVCLWRGFYQLLGAEYVDGDFWRGGLRQFWQWVENRIGFLELLKLSLLYHVNRVDIRWLVELNYRRLDFIELPHNDYLLERVHHLNRFGRKRSHVLQSHPWKLFGLRTIAKHHNCIVIFSERVEKCGRKGLVYLCFLY